MLSKVVAYVRFLKESNNQHGIHSPFVYDFITKCLYKRKPYLDHQNLKKFFKQLSFLGDSTLSAKRIELLIRITSYFNPDWVLDFSDTTKLVAGGLSLQNKRKIFNLTSSTNSKKIPNPLLGSSCNKLDFISDDLSQGFFSLHQKPFCLVLLSKNVIHQDIKHLESACTSLSTQSLIILEGIYHSKENEQIWEQIKNLNQVSVTVDLFFWGIIFLQKGQAKQHFKIRV